VCLWIEFHHDFLVTSGTAADSDFRFWISGWNRRTANRSNFAHCASPMIARTSALGKLARVDRLHKSRHNSKSNASNRHSPRAGKNQAI
jgi:hypothetical protein